jgi:hypothetical protein
MKTLSRIVQFRGRQCFEGNGKTFALLHYWSHSVSTFSINNIYPNDRGVSIILFWSE